MFATDMHRKIESVTHSKFKQLLFTEWLSGCNKLDQERECMIQPYVTHMISVHQVCQLPCQ